MEIGKEYALGLFKIGDCVQVGGKIGVVLGRNAYYIHIQYENASIAGYSEHTAVVYKGKGKVTIEFPKQPTLEDAAIAFKESLGLYSVYVHFIKLEKDKLIVYHSKEFKYTNKNSLGFPIELVYVPDSKILK